MKTDKTFTNVMAWTNVQVRNFAGPTEYYSIFDSLSAAQAYASATGAYADTPVAYEGQVIAAPNEAGKMTIYVLTKVEGEDHLIPAGVNAWGTVAELKAAAISSDAIPVGYTAVATDEKGEQALYMITEKEGTKTVEPVGTKVVADNKTLSVDADGIIGLVGVENLISGHIYTPKFVNGILDWVDSTETPSPDDLSAIVAEHERRLSNIEDIKIPGLNKRIDDEISAREAADVELLSAIDKVAGNLAAHTLTCEAADDFISAAIDTEISARISADEELQVAIDIVDGRVTKLSGEVSAISSDHTHRIGALETLTTEHTTQITEISSKVNTLAGRAFEFIGKYDNLEAVPKENEEIGNVVIVGNSEYVYVNDGWELLGDTGDFATLDYVDKQDAETLSAANAYTDNIVDNILSIASEAKELAETASTNATSAISEAGAAKELANQAQASTASAEQAALSAQASATQAATDAAQAATDAGEAKELAETASTNATSALTTAAQAATDASEAKQTANTAKSKADEAILSAGSIAETVQEIQTKIGDVEGNIDETIEELQVAISTEETSRISADELLSKSIADLVTTTESSILALSSELTSADNRICELIALSVGELTEQIGGINTTINGQISDLNTALTNEIDERVSADSAINVKINELEQAITTHAASCEVADVELLSAIDKVAGDLAAHTVSCASADVALQTAIDKVDGRVTKLSDEVVTISGELSTAIEEINTGLSGYQKKIITENGLTGLTGDIVKIGLDITALTSTTIFADGLQLGVNISAVTNALSNALTTRIASCETSVGTLNTSLTDLSGEVSAISSKLSGTISSISSDLYKLSNEVSGISADHEGRLDTLSAIVDGLTNATRFIGVADDLSDITNPNAQKIKIKGKEHTISSGDIVIYGDAEYIAVHAGILDKEGDFFEWVQLGDESVCAETLKRVDELSGKFEAHVTTCEAADAKLTKDLADEISARIDADDTLSTAISALSDAFEAHVISCEDADAKLTKDLADEISARIDADEEIHTELSAHDSRIQEIEDTLAGVLVLNGGNAFGW